MYAKGIKSDFAFTRNPIIVCDPLDEIDWGDDAPGIYTVELGGKKIYEGHVSPWLTQEVNVAEIADSAVPFIPEADPDGAIIQNLEWDTSGLPERRLYVNAKIQGGESEYDCFVFPGGVSKQNFRTYLAHGEDCFSARFLNFAGNFFLTTRTSSWLIRMKETELSPLYFVVGGDKELLIVPADIEDPESYSYCEDLTWGVYSLNIAAYRRNIYRGDTGPGSIFDVYVDEQFACRIVIEEAAPAKERYRVKFRNSLGVFDIIDIVGHAVESSGAPEEEDVYKRYDDSIDDFVNVRERAETSTTISISSMVKRRDDLPLLLDMIGSDEIYLLDVSDEPIRAVVSTEGLEYGLKMDAPLPYTLKFELAESEQCMTPRIDSANDSVRPQIFSKQFSKQFK